MKNPLTDNLRCLSPPRAGRGNRLTSGLHPVPPSPRPSPRGRGRMVLRLSITSVPEFAQQPSAEHQSDACCSLSLRERVRVRGKNSAEHAKCSISQELLSKWPPSLRPSVALGGCGRGPLHFYLPPGFTV